MISQQENQFDEVRRFVEANRLEDAISRLVLVDGYRNYASQFRARLARLEEQDRKGLRTRVDVDAERNKISEDILGVIEVSSTSVEEVHETLQPSYAHLRPALKEPPFILPHRDVVSFTGRYDELEKLESAIFRTSGPREAGIAGLTGTGGIGKSVLAFHFATTNRDRFPDGVIGLRVDEDEPEIIAQRFAYHAGATIPPGEMLSASEIMQSVFRNKQALLIFDNAEDASVKLLRPGGNRCAIIVTTRNRGLLRNLEIAESGHVELDPFTLDETRELLGKIIGAERVEAEPQALERIYELVGGLPLAIRIAGGTLDDQPFTNLDQFAQLLADERERLRYLRDPEDPDLNVEASFELSLKWLESLNETEVVKAFACLGACPREGFSLLAAQVVSEPDELSINGILGRLARLSLINQGERADEFTLHPLLSVFARRKAEAFGWLSDVVQRHTDFFLQYVLDHSEPSPDNFKALEAELNSLLLAGGRLASSGQPSHGFYVAIEPFLEANGYWSQALNLVDQFFAAARANDDFQAMAQLALQRGQFLQLSGKFEKAKDSFLESETFAARVENAYQREHIQAIVLNSLGGVYQRQGNFDQAVAAFEQGREILERLSDVRGVGMVLNSLGGVYQRQGNFQQAVTAFEESMEISQEMGDERGVGMVLNSLGGVYQRLGNFSQALAAFERSTQIFEKFGDERGLGMVLNSLGGVYQRQGYFALAVAAFERSRDMGEKVGNERHVGMVLNSLGGVYQRQGNFPQAVAAFERSKQIFEGFNDERGLAMVHNSLGGVYQRQGKFESAVHAFERSREISERYGDERGLAMVLNSLGSSYQRVERYAEAVEALKRSAELERKFGNLRGLAMVLNSLSGAYRKQDSGESLVEAIAVLKQSGEIDEKLGNLRGLAMVLNSLGDLYQRQHDYNQAITVLQRSYDLSVSLGDIRGQAMVLTSLGKVYSLNGNLNAAIQAFEKSIAIEKSLDNERGKAMVLCAWGKALLRHQHPAQAEEKLRASFDIDESLRNVKGLRVVTPSLVRALTILRQREVAKGYLARALAVAPTDLKLLKLQEQLAEERQVSVRTSVKTGIIKRLVRNRAGYRYGFIAASDGSEDIYFGEDTVSQDLLRDLVEGVRVGADVELSARGPRARSVWRDDG